jgi:hypothetical protein
MDHSKRQRTDAKADFESWLHENGVDLSWIRFDDGDCGTALTNDRHATAKQDTPPGTDFLTIPRKIVITEHVARDSAVGKAATDFFGDVEAQTVLFLFMIDSRFRKGAFWGPYCKYLPSVYDDPLWFSVDALRELQGTNLGSALPNYKASLREKYDRLFPTLSLQQPHLFPAEWFTWDNFLWARSSYTSRGFTPKLMQSAASQEIAPTTAVAEDAENEQGQCGCMMPGFDMLNHGYGTQITWFVDTEMGQVSFRSGDTTTLAGAELKNNYGAKGNEHFLLNYGFCIEDNPVDTVIVKIGLQEGGRGGSPRALALNAIGKRHLLTVWMGQKTKPVEEVERANRDPNLGISCAPSLLCAMRLCAMDDEEEYFSIQPDLSAGSRSAGGVSVRVTGVDESEDRPHGGVCMEYVLAKARTTRVSDRCEYHVLQQLQAMISAKLVSIPLHPPVDSSTKGASKVSWATDAVSSSAPSPPPPSSKRHAVHLLAAQTYRTGQRQVLQHSLRQICTAMRALQTSCRTQAQQSSRPGSNRSAQMEVDTDASMLVTLVELQPELRSIDGGGSLGIAPSASLSSPSTCAAIASPSDAAPAASLPTLHGIYTTSAVSQAGESLLRLPLDRVLCVRTAMRVPGLGNALQLVQGLQEQAGGSDAHSTVLLLALTLLYVRARLETGAEGAAGKNDALTRAQAQPQGQAKPRTRITKEALEDFYRTREPSKLPLVPHILATFAVDNLIDGLRAKYGEAPVAEVIRDDEGAASVAAGEAAGEAAEGAVDVAQFFPFVEALLAPPKEQSEGSHGEYKDALGLFPASEETANSPADSPDDHAHYRCHAATLWTDPELELLGLSPAGRQLRIEVEERQEQQRDMHTQLFPALCEAMPTVFTPASSFDVEHFMWALAVVQDRAVWVHPPESTSSDPLLCVLPLLVRPRPVTSTAQNCRCELRQRVEGCGEAQGGKAELEGEWVELVSLGEMDQHVEVVAAPWWIQGEDLASCCNNDLLLYHGIALSSNPFDTVSITIPAQTSVSVLAFPTDSQQEQGSAIRDDGSGTATRGWGGEEVRACLAALQEHSALEKNKRFKAVAKAVSAVTNANARPQAEGAAETKVWSKRECYDWCMRNLGATLDPERLLLAPSEAQNGLSRQLQLPSHHYLPLVPEALVEIGGEGGTSTADRGGQAVQVIPWPLHTMAWVQSLADAECAQHVQQMKSEGGKTQAGGGRAGATPDNVQRARAVLERAIRYGQREWEGADGKSGKKKGKSAGGAAATVGSDSTADVQHRKALATAFRECHRTIWRTALAHAATWEGSGL